MFVIKRQMGIVDTIKRFGVLALGIVLTIIGTGLGVFGYVKKGHKNVDTGTTTTTTGTSATGTSVSVGWQFLFWGGLVILGMGLGMIVAGVIMAVVYKPVVAVIKPSQRPAARIYDEY